MTQSCRQHSFNKNKASACVFTARFIKHIENLNQMMRKKRYVSMLPSKCKRSSSEKSRNIPPYSRFKSLGKRIVAAVFNRLQYNVQDFYTN